MKKFPILLVITALILATLCGCDVSFEVTGPNGTSKSWSAGAEDTAATTTTEVDKSETTGTTATEKVDSVVDPEDGTVLEVDLSVRGEIKTDSADVRSNTIVFEGREVRLPLAASILFDNGWRFSDNTDASEKKIQPNTITSLISFYLYNANGDEISLRETVNKSDVEKPVSECEITSFEVSTWDLTENFKDVVLPGGLCLFSTAADVIQVYGTPENNPYFEDVWVDDDSIIYSNHKNTGYTFYFGFYGAEDLDGQLNGKIRYLTVSIEHDMIQ